MVFTHGSRLVEWDAYQSGLARMKIMDSYIEVPTPLPQSRRTGRNPSSDASRDGESFTGEDIKVMVRYVMAGEGPAVVMVHGLGASLAIWERNIAPLAEGHTVYAVDLPGSGKSDKPKALDYHSVAGAQFLIRLMDTLGINRATLIGNSGGGLVTTICALTYPERVDKLVLVDSAGLGRQMAWFLRLASLPFLGELLHIPNVRNPDNLVKSIFYEPQLVSAAALEDIMKARNTPLGKRVTLEELRSGVSFGGLRKDMMMLHKLKDYPKPLLIVWGEEDRLIPVSHAYHARRVLACDGDEGDTTAPYRAVHVIPHCGHWPQMERPDEFNPLVLSFLDGGH